MSTNLLGRIVHCYPPVPPSGSTSIVWYADDPLEISSQNSPHTTSKTITDGKTLSIYEIKIGAGKDPTEKGSRIEVIYEDSSGESPVEYIFDRFYVSNDTMVFTYPEQSFTRDGTSMDGKTGSKGKLLLRRTRLSGAGQEVEIVIRGCEA